MDAFHAYFSHCRSTLMLLAYRYVKLLLEWNPIEYWNILKCNEPIGWSQVVSMFLVSRPLPHRTCEKWDPATSYHIIGDEISSLPIKKLHLSLHHSGILYKLSFFRPPSLRSSGWEDVFLTNVQYITALPSRFMFTPIVTYPPRNIKTLYLII